MNAHDARSSWAVMLAAALAAMSASGCKGGGKDRIRRTADAAPVELTGSDQMSKRRAGAAEREPNDRAAEAGPLALEAVGRGRLDTPTDIDRYRVAVEKPGALTVTVSGLSTIDLIVELRDGSDAVLARSDRGGVKISEGIGGYPVTAGGYDVVVQAFVKPGKTSGKSKPRKGAEPAPPAAAAGSGSAGVPVVLTEPSEEYEVIATLGEAVVAGQELEPNPDAGAASELAIGETVGGLLGWSGDVDVWKLGTEVLAASDALDFELTGVEGVTATLEVRDGMSRPQATRKGGRSQPVAIRGYVPKVPEGTPPILYVAVSGERSHPQLGYQLKVSARGVGAADEREPNDRPETAQPFAEESDGSPLLHARWEAGDVDCFAIPVASARRRIEVVVNAADGAGLSAELLVGERVVAKTGAAIKGDRPVDRPGESGQASRPDKLEPMLAEVPAGARAVVRVRGPAKAAAEAAEVQYDVSWAEAASDAMPPEEGAGSTP